MKEWEFELRVRVPVNDYARLAELLPKIEDAFRTGMASRSVPFCECMVRIIEAKIALKDQP